MFSAVEWMVALRYLRARRSEGFISVIAGFSLLGIALGVGTLIVVLSVMNGFRAELLGRILGLNGHVMIQAQGAPLTGFDSIADAVRRVPGVTGVVPIVDGQVMATSDQGASGALVRGMRVSDLQAQESIRKGLVLGSLDNIDPKNDIIVGYRLLQRLNVRVGDGVTLISPQGSATAFGTVPRSRTYRVAASFNIGMFEYDSNFVFMPLEAAQLYFRMGEGVGALEVKIADPDQIGRFRAPIADAAGPNVRLTDWQQVNSQYFTALQVERNVMFLILTLIILVAAFNIISSMIMLVKEKGRDIAILRTMGATRGMILRVFLIAGASVGIVGTFTGFLLGVLFADNIESIRQFIQSLTGTELFAAEIYFLSQLPAKVDPREVIMVTAMGLGLSFLATIYPSWRAARLDPVEALRYE